MLLMPLPNAWHHHHITSLAMLIVISTVEAVILSITEYVIFTIVSMIIMVVISLHTFLQDLNRIVKGKQKSCHYQPHSHDSGKSG